MYLLKMCSTWPGTPTRARPGSTTDGGARSRGTSWNGSRSDRHHPGLGMTAGQNQPPPTRLPKPQRGESLGGQAPRRLVNSDSSATARRLPGEADPWAAPGEPVSFVEQPNPFGATEPGTRQAILAVAYSPDDVLLFTGGLDSTIKVWDIPEITFMDAAVLQQLDLQTVDQALAVWSQIQQTQAVLSRSSKTASRTLPPPCRHSSPAPPRSRSSRSLISRRSSRWERRFSSPPAGARRSRRCDRDDPADGPGH